MARRMHILPAVRSLAVAVAIAAASQACGSGAIHGEARPGKSTPEDPKSTATTSSAVPTGNSGGGSGGNPSGTGSGHTTGGGQVGGTGTGGGGTLPGSEKPVEDEEEYPFELPLGDTSLVNLALEDDLYLAIAGGRLDGQFMAANCSAAQRRLDDEWYRLKNPRAVLLYQAGAHLCRAKETPSQRGQLTDQARSRFEQATKDDGWGGVGASPTGEMDCDMYQAVGSVVRQWPKDSFPCLPGAPKRAWPRGSNEFGPHGKDNPLTPEDESATTATTR